MDSVFLGLAISLVLGLVYTLILMGPAPLNPRNTAWLGTDPGDYYIGWELFRQDPHWHWPLTYTNRVGYPVGEAVALMDLDPSAGGGAQAFFTSAAGTMPVFGT